MDVQTDFLVIGTGIAGLSFALQAAKLGSVAIVTKRRKDDTNTNRAQGGIATVLDAVDNFDLHVEDTLVAGAGLCHRDVVEHIVREGPRIVRQLVEWGVEFTRTPEGEYALGREGGHSHSRIVHAHDLTGAEIERALLDAVQRDPNVRIFEDHVAVDLITEHHLPHARPGRHVTCWGAYVLSVHEERVYRFLARKTALATGGAGQAWRHTTNPDIATGDGIAMAYRAGARVGNLEFMQFHPTTLYHAHERSFLISEAVRGHGAVLINDKGEHFMDSVHPMKSLAPRDIVARAIDREMKTTGRPCVFLDITHKSPEDIRARFPNIYQKCLSLGIDITTEPIPVVPAAHYMCGGVVADTSSRTDITNLYACGEVAMSGLHGANRLASNSLLEAVVMANGAINDIRQSGFRAVTLPDIPAWDDSEVFDVEEWILLRHDLDEIRDLMWDYVGIVRSDVRLRRAHHRLELIWREVEEFYRRAKVTADLIELRNMACLAALVVRCAMSRNESRGLHFTTDYPERDDQRFKRDTILRARRRRKMPLDPPRRSITGKISEHHAIPGTSDTIHQDFR
jgi:L-aspartate oxidase